MIRGMKRTFTTIAIQLEPWLMRAVIALSIVDAVWIASGESISRRGQLMQTFTIALLAFSHLRLR